MNLSQEEQEKKVRPLAQLDLSTRKIAEATGISQPTVVRTLKRIKTGPQPIIQNGNHGAPEDHSRKLRVTRPFAIVCIVLFILAIAVAGVAWAKILHPAITTRIPICAQYAANGTITHVTTTTDSMCPAGWRMLILTPVQ